MVDGDQSASLRAGQCARVCVCCFGRPVCITKGPCRCRRMVAPASAFSRSWRSFDVVHRAPAPSLPTATRHRQTAVSIITKGHTVPLKSSKLRRLSVRERPFSSRRRRRIPLATRENKKCVLARRLLFFWYRYHVSKTVIIYCFVLFFFPCFSLFPLANASSMNCVPTSA